MGFEYKVDSGRILTQRLPRKVRKVYVEYGCLERLDFTSLMLQCQWAASQQQARLSPAERTQYVCIMNRPTQYKAQVQRTITAAEVASGTIGSDEPSSQTLMK